MQPLQPLKNLPKAQRTRDYIIPIISECIEYYELDTIGDITELNNNTLMILYIRLITLQNLVRLSYEGAMTLRNTREFNAVVYEADNITLDKLVYYSKLYLIALNCFVNGHKGAESTLRRISKHIKKLRGLL